MIRWASAECTRQELEVTNENKRRVLGHAVNLIRFPLMTIEEFAQGPAQSGLLVEREVVELFLYFTLNPKPRVKKRSKFIICFYTVLCFRFLIPKLSAMVSKAKNREQ